MALAPPSVEATTDNYVESTEFVETPKNGPGFRNLEEYVVDVPRFLHSNIAPDKSSR
jgi:hypothetical protein